MANKIWLIIVILLSSARCMQAQAEMSKLTVSAEDFNGGAVEWAKIELLELGTGKDFSRSFSPAHVADIPYGVYRLRVAANGMASYEQIVNANQDRTFVRVRLSPGHISGTKLNRLSGKVISQPSEHMVWIKLVPLLSNDSLMDYGLASDGSFEFVGPDTGHYLLAVVVGTKVVKTEEVWVNGESTITINVP